MTEVKMTEQEIRRIAREESMAVFEKAVVKIDKELSQVNRFSKATQETLARLERLLLGEMGVEKEDTLKARATYAYQYARRNTDLRIPERTIPVLDWFESWDKPEAGCDESRLQIIGKIITAYSSIKWLLAFLGMTTLINAIPAIKMIIEFLEGIL